MSGRRKVEQEYNDDSYLDDNGDESIIQSPAKNLPIRNVATHSRQPPTQQNSRSYDGTKEQHEAKLRQELASVRKVNEAIEGVLESLEKAKNNMKSVNQTVGNASALLNIWTRILSQTEHNQRLVLDPSWQGASQDITDLEEEAQAKQQAAEQREAEEQERKAALVRKAEEDERRRAEAASTSTKPKPALRGRGGLGRGSSTGRAGYVTIGGSNTASTPGTARGSASARRTAGRLGRGAASRGTRGQG